MGDADGKFARRKQLPKESQSSIWIIFCSHTLSSGFSPIKFKNVFQFKRRTAWRSHFNMWLAMLSNFVLRPFIGDDKSDFLPVTGKQCFKFQYLIHSKLFYVRVLLELHFAFVKFLRIFSSK